MEARAFEQAMQSLVARRPFRPYTVELASGSRIEIDRAEAMIVRAGVIVFVDAQGVPMFFDHQSVSQLIGAPTDLPA